MEATCPRNHCVIAAKGLSKFLKSDPESIQLGVLVVFRPFSPTAWLRNSVRKDLIVVACIVLLGPCRRVVVSLTFSGSPNESFALALPDFRLTTRSSQVQNLSILRFASDWRHPRPTYPSSYLNSLVSDRLPAPAIMTSTSSAPATPTSSTPSSARSSLSLSLSDRLNITASDLESKIQRVVDHFTSKSKPVKIAVDESQAALDKGYLGGWVGGFGGGGGKKDGLREMERFWLVSGVTL